MPMSHPRISARVGAISESATLAVDAKAKALRAEGRPVHILDPAAGGGRYVLDAVSKLQGEPVTVTLRDRNPVCVEAAAKLARDLKLSGVQAIPGDAFDGVLLAALARHDDPEIALRRASAAGARVAATGTSWP